MNENSPSDLISGIGKDVLQYAPALLLPALINIVALRIYTNIFNPSEYGAYSVLITTINIINIFAYTWINLANLRFFQIYGSKGKSKEYISTTFWTMLAALSIVSVFFIIFQKKIENLDFMSDYVYLILIAIITSAYFESIITILTAKRKMVVISVTRSLLAILNLIISLVFIIIFHLRISALFCGLILGNIILTPFLIKYLDIELRLNPKFFSKRILHESIKYGIPLISALLFSWILQLSNRYILEIFRDDSEVGIYSVFYQLIGLPLSMIVTVIATSTFPFLVQTWETEGEKLTANFVDNIIKYYLILSAPFLITVSILAKEITFIIGKEYILGSAVIPWIGIGYLLSGLCVFINKGLELSKKTNILTLILSTSAIINLTCNILLIPKYGLVGAGIATGVSYLVYLLISIIVSDNYLKLNFNFADYSKIIVSCILMGLIMHIAKLYILSTIFSVPFIAALGFLVYFISIYLFGVIKIEMEIIKGYFLTEINRS